MAQWLAQGTHNSLVAGSNPAGPTSLQLLIDRYAKQTTVDLINSYKSVIDD